MRRVISKHLTFVFAVFLLSGSSLAGDKQDRAADLALKALQKSNVWTDGPVQLTAKIRVPSVAHAPDLNLECQMYWDSAEKWRTDWTGAGYSEKVVVNGGKLYRYRNSAAPPIQVLAINNALAIALGNNPVAPFFEPEPSQKPKVEISKAKVKETSSAKVKETSSTCVDPSFIHGKLCFDPSNLSILQYEDSGMLATYEDFASLHGATYPQTLRLTTKDGKLIGDAKITIKPATQFAEDTFKPIDGGSVSNYSSCADVGKIISAPKLDNKIFPKYPEAARNARQQGTVWLYASVRGDGSIDKVEALGGGVPDLRNASVEAVRQWRYSPPYMRCGVPTPFETLISVNFTLQ